MNKSDEMKHFVNSAKGWPGQLLDVVANGFPFTFELIHATVNQSTSYGKHSSEHIHDVYHVVLCTAGDGVASLNGEPIAMRPGMLVSISPGEGHTFSLIRPGQCRYHEITFQLTHHSTFLTISLRKYLEALLGLEGVHLPRPLQLEPGVAEGAMRRYKRILEALTLEDDTLAASMEILALLLAIAGAGRPAQSTESTPQTRLNQVKRHLELHFSSNDTVDDLADHACLSRGHFLREFKRSVGTSPIQYRLALRMEAAKSLLITSNLQCKEISDRLGFGDEFHFSRTFKRHVGVSPSAFRNNSNISP